MAGTVVDGRHATSRYQQVVEGVIDELQGAHLRGDGVQRVAPWLSMEDKRCIVAETLDADRVVDLPTRLLLTGEEALGEMTDFKWAAIAERLMDASRAGSKAARNARVNDLLCAVGRSPTASPTLSYEPLYRDLAETALLDRDASAINWLKRVLGHNLHFHHGDDVTFALVDLASAYLQLDDLDKGLLILAKLIEHDPADQWIYRFLATGFGVLGLADLGLRGARQGLALLDENGDPDDLHDELLMAEFDLLATPKRGREHEVSADVLAEFEAALALPFDQGDSRAADELCRDLVPELEDIPVKRPLRLRDLPDAVRALVA